MTSNEAGRPGGVPPHQGEEVESLDHSSPSSPDEDLAGFFRVLAASFAHARNGRSSGGASKKPRLQGDGPQPARRLWPRPVLLAAGLCAVLIWTAPALFPAREVIVPDTIVGSWNTLAPLYRDRGFTITKTSLVLKAGLNGAEVHPIARVRIAHSGEAVVYTIEYLVEQAGYEFSFRLWPGHPPVLRSVHQPEVAWRKESN